MKTAAFVAAIGVVISNFATAEECSATTLSFALLPLAPQVGLCTVDSAYELYPFEGMPSIDQLREICKSDACKTLLSEAHDSDLPDCEVTINGTAHNVKQSVDLIASGCKVSNFADDLFSW
ncbi:hypothetical protein PHYBOEH_008890 [Phytophthora boehmeriae]|uniref:Elicitin n=1 Tax=Phytophthora boehmeriae TaxID=109152 RepID=A0A8T1VWT5_9STRA|nr:hypothetical protein PHYBOEH_008890 [Phytophthora boehmeriae]